MTTLRDAAMTSKAWPFEEARRVLKRYAGKDPAKGYVLFETGSAKKLPEIVGQFGAKRVMLVTDKGVRGAGLTRSAEEALAAEPVRAS